MSELEQPEDWYFREPRDEEVLTTRPIMFERKSILHVSRDATDGQWQFLTGEPSDIGEVMLVALQTIVARDPTVCELVDMLPGWEATRLARGAPWTWTQTALDGTVSDFIE